MNNNPNCGRSAPTRPATAAQIKALYAIARRQKLDLCPWLQERCRVSRPEELTISQASYSIDELKKTEPTVNY